MLFSKLIQQHIRSIKHLSSWAEHTLSLNLTVFPSSLHELTFMTLMTSQVKWMGFTYWLCKQPSGWLLHLEICTLSRIFHWKGILGHCLEIYLLQQLPYVSGTIYTVNWDLEKCFCYSCIIRSESVTRTAYLLIRLCLDLPLALGIPVILENQSSERGCRYPLGAGKLSREEQLCGWP